MDAQLQKLQAELDSNDTMSAEIRRQVEKEVKQKWEKILDAEKQKMERELESAKQEADVKLKNVSDMAVQKVNEQFDAPSLRTAICPAYRCLPPVAQISAAASQF